MIILDQLCKPKGPYKLKGVGTPEYYFRGNVKIKYQGDIINYLGISAKTYIKKVAGKLQTLMEWRLKDYASPEGPDYHLKVIEVSIDTWVPPRGSTIVCMEW